MITKLGKSLCKMLPLLLGSLAAGAINGLFGMGGGIVIYFYFIIVIYNILCYNYPVILYIAKVRPIIAAVII